MNQRKTERDRDRGTETQRDTERDRDRGTERHRETETDVKLMFTKQSLLFCLRTQPEWISKVYLESDFTKGNCP